MLINISSLIDKWQSKCCFWNVSLLYRSLY